jgi:hypothetical protein
MFIEFFKTGAEGFLKSTISNLDPILFAINMRLLNLS